jgi:streptomycin 6-kinase
MKWTKDLSKIIDRIANKYKLTQLTPISSSNYNYVMSGLYKEQSVILKLSLDKQSLQLEAKALKAFHRVGAVKIINQEEGMLLIEKVVPGDSLKPYYPLEDEEAINIACKVIKRLQSVIPLDNTFPHIKDWLSALDKDWEVPIHYLNKARTLRDKLLQTSMREVLLHGDLHHDNILQNVNDWVVIDPKGVIGEPTYEVAAFIRNPIPELLEHTDVRSIINNRISQFAKCLGLSKERILSWCFVQAVLAWVWALEDNTGCEHFQELTEIFYEMVTIVKPL